MNKKKLMAEARALWEEVFPEDSAQFLDYYDACVAVQNKIYTEKEQGTTVSMIHRNPYRVHLGEKEADVSYLVAVATREAYRRQGRMTRLLQTVLEDSYRDREPFVYLMPASEKIYLPHGFRTVGKQSVLTLGSVFPAKTAKSQRLICKKARYSQLEELAAFSESCLLKYCAVYTVRTLSYFQRMWKEQEAVNGAILLFYQGERLAGYCFSGMEEGAEIWELVTDPATPGMQAGMLRAVTEYFQKDLPLKVSGMLPGTQVQGVDLREISYRPMTMVRLTNLYALADRLRAERPAECTLDICDPLLPQNNGRFHLSVDTRGGRLEKTGAGGSDAVCVTVEELTEALFGLRTQSGFSGLGIRPLRPVFFNELV